MIHLASETLRGALEREYVLRHGPLADNHVAFRFDVPEAEPANAAVVSLYLYRVEVDRTHRHRTIPPAELGGRPRWALSLELHYLLTVSSDSPQMQQEQLGRCMAILDARAELSGDDLARPQGWTASGSEPDPWLPGSAVRVSLEDMTNEDMLRLWDALEPRYRLSVPYLVRTVQLAPVESDGDRMADHRVVVVTRRA